MSLPDYELSLDPARVDWTRVHRWLASSYWTPAISIERVRVGAANSALVISAFQKATGAQVGFARVVSDKTRFAYLCDVWVDEAHRKKGIARAMVKLALDHPEFQTVKWLLATLDAHGVYGELGFSPLTDPERWMVRKPAA